MKITDENRADILNIMSDLSKEAFGFRNRSRNWSAMTNEELQADFDYYREVCEENAIEEEKQLVIDRQRYEDTIQKTIDTGANDRTTALKWLYDGSDVGGPHSYQDIEHFIWQQGLLFHKDSKALCEELADALIPDRKAA